MIIRVADPAILVGSGLKKFEFEYRVFVKLDPDSVVVPRFRKPYPSPKTLYNLESCLFCSRIRLLSRVGSGTGNFPPGSGQFTSGSGQFPPGSTAVQ